MRLKYCRCISGLIINRLNIKSNGVAKGSKLNGYDSTHGLG